VISRRDIPSESTSLETLVSSSFSCCIFSSSCVDVDEYRIEMTTFAAASSSRAQEQTR
jgi:hypothetical protein